MRQPAPPTVSTPVGPVQVADFRLRGIKGSEATVTITPAQRMSPSVACVTPAWRAQVCRCGEWSPHPFPSSTTPKSRRREDVPAGPHQPGVLQALGPKGGGGQKKCALSSSGGSGAVCPASCYIVTSLDLIGPFHRPRKLRLREVTSHAQEGQCPSPPPRPLPPSGSSSQHQHSLEPSSLLLSRPHPAALGAPGDGSSWGRQARNSGPVWGILKQMPKVPLAGKPEARSFRCRLASQEPSAAQACWGS